MYFFLEIYSFIFAPKLTLAMFRFLFFFIFLIITSCGEQTPMHQAQSNEDFLKERKQKRIEDSLALLASMPKIDTNLITYQNVTQKLTTIAQNNLETKLKIKTTLGNIEIRLFEDTPLHRANFIHLTKTHYFDNTLFYRVIDNFMIQGGNSDRDDISYKMSKIGNYTVPEEIMLHHIHKRGALAMAVSEQLEIPEKDRTKNSSPYNFYIIQNGPMSYDYLKGVEEKYDIKISKKHKKIYNQIGGAPHLDGKFTVFGEVTKGMDVVDKIAKVKTNSDSRPIDDIIMSVKIIGY